jgi:hypothetical protein
MHNRTRSPRASAAAAFAQTLARLTVLKANGIAMQQKRKAIKSFQRVLAGFATAGTTWRTNSLL